MLVTITLIAAFIVSSGLAVGCFVELVDEARRRAFWPIMVYSIGAFLMAIYSLKLIVMML